MDFTKLLISVIFLSLTISACNKSSSGNLDDENDGDNQSSSGGSSAFKSMQAAILIPKCASCHNSETLKGGFDVETYAAIMESGHVVAGSANKSNLCQVLKSGKMPPSKPLTTAQINSVCNWIQSGAE